MSQFPAMPLWCADFFSKTDHLANDEQWAYLKLLMKTWVRNGRPFPDNDRDLARILDLTPKRWLKIRPRIAPFFDLSTGTWRQARLDEVFQKVASRSQSSRSNGALGGRPKSRDVNTLENPAGLLTESKPKAVKTKEETPATQEYPVQQASPASQERVSQASLATHAPKRQEIAEAMAATWKEVCGDCLPAPAKLTTRRVTACAARWHDTFANAGENWRAFCERIRRTPFLCGENDRGWRADFDWVLSPANALKVMEGRYDGSRQSPHDNGAAAGYGREDDLTWRSLLKTFRDEGRWFDSHGPPPSDPYCEVPDRLLAEFGWVRAKLAVRRLPTEDEIAAVHRMLHPQDAPTAPSRGPPVG